MEEKRKELDEKNGKYVIGKRFGTIGILQECKEGETAAYLTANEEAFREAVKVAAACIEKQLQIQRIINNAMRQCMILLHEE